MRGQTTTCRKQRLGGGVQISLCATVVPRPVTNIYFPMRQMTCRSCRRQILAARPILIAQISDLHITRPGELAYGRVDTAKALLRTIDTLNGLSPRPDLIVISGDIADSALPEEYAHATKLLGALQVPFVAIPGNHDRRVLIRETFPDPAYGTSNCALNTVRRVGGLDIFLIDSTVAGAPHGELDARRLLGSMDRSAHRPHGLPSYFCIILHSTRGLRTRTRCACGTPTRLPRSSDDTNACCWSRRGMFIAQRKPCSRAFRPVSARRENRQSHSNSNHAGRKFSESSRRPSICTHGFPDRDLEAWLLTSCRSGNFPGPTPTATPKPPRLRCKAQFLGGSDRSFFGNLQRLYSFVPGQPGYGDKWPSQ